MSIALLSLVSCFLLFLTHWACIQFYAVYCAPPGLSGFLKSFLSAPTPLCLAANYLQYYSIEMYYLFWLQIVFSLAKLSHDYLVSIRKRITPGSDDNN